MQQHPPSLQHSPHFFNWSQQPLAQLLQSSHKHLQQYPGNSQQPLAQLLQSSHKHSQQYPGSSQQLFAQLLQSSHKQGVKNSQNGLYLHQSLPSSRSLVEQLRQSFEQQQQQHQTINDPANIEPIITPAKAPGLKLAISLDFI
jgi:hypothetical protein